MIRSHLSYHRNWLLAVIIGALILPTSIAQAGDAPELLFVNMTPDAYTSKKSTACIRLIKNTIDSTSLTKIGETKARTAIGIPKTGMHFLQWNYSHLKPLVTASIGDFSVLLVDCRPSQEVLDVLALDVNGTSVAISLRNMSLRKPLLRATASRVSYGLGALSGFGR